jgi:glycosyltransferase involved in cell wall biosynthesis
MKILFLDQHTEGSVFEKLNYYYIKGLSSADDVRIFSSAPFGYKGRITELGIEIIELSFRSKVDFNCIKMIINFSNEKKIDLIHCHNNKTLANAIIASYWMKRKPKIICRRGIVRKINPWDPSEWITYLNPNFTHTIALSNAIKKNLIEESNFSEGSVTTIYQAIEPDWIVGDENLDIHHELDIPKDALLIGCVANYRPVKGLEVFIKAINTLEHLNAYYLFIGKGCEEALSSLLTDQQRLRVRFLGFQENPATFVKALDIYLQPSLSEGLSFSVIEAMLLQKAMIVSDVGGMSELVEHRIRGLKVPPNDIVSLRDAIQELAYDFKFRNDLGIEAYSYATKEFNLPKMVGCTLQLYRQLLAPFPGRLISAGDLQGHQHRNS